MPSSLDKLLESQFFSNTVVPLLDSYKELVIQRAKVPELEAKAAEIAEKIAETTGKYKEVADWLNYQFYQIEVRNRPSQEPHLN